MKRLSVFRFVGGGAFALLTALFSGPSSSGQQSSAPEIINWNFPLERAAERMQQVYARPVTYEDPMRLWSGAMVAKGHLPNGSDFLVVRPHTFILPEWPSFDKVPALDLATVTNVVEAYHRQNPGQPAYQVIASSMGFHIVPIQAHDVQGRLGPAVSVLDSVVSVPIESRTASEHLAALCLAVTNATGIPTESWKTAFDQYYAANGYLLPRALTKTERPYMLFE
jgi:hypothetical protein